MLYVSYIDVRPRLGHRRVVHVDLPKGLLCVAQYVLCPMVCIADEGDIKTLRGRVIIANNCLEYLPCGDPDVDRELDAVHVGQRGRRVKGVSALLIEVSHQRCSAPKPRLGAFDG